MVLGNGFLYNKHMQVFVQLVLYQPSGNGLEVMLVKPAKGLGNYWQPVTRAIREDESVQDAFKREIKQGTGLHHVEHLSQEIYTYEWFLEGTRGRSLVFFAQVAPDTEVTLDKKYDASYEWLDYDEAHRRLHWIGEREALEKLAHSISASASDGSSNSDSTTDTTDTPQSSSTNPAATTASPAASNTQTAQANPEEADEPSTARQTSDKPSANNASPSSQSPVPSSHAPYPKFADPAPPAPLPDIDSVAAPESSIVQPDASLASQPARSIDELLDAVQLPGHMSEPTVVHPDAPSESDASEPPHPSQEPPEINDVRQR